MIVTVRLFAAARQFAQSAEVKLQLGSDCTVAEVRRLLLEQHPELKPILELARFAVNAQYATDSTPIAEGDEIACIPPVSGG